MSPKQITVNSRKYDQKIRRSWSGGLVSQTGSLLAVVGRFDSDVKHNDLGLIKRGTVSAEFFWLDRWYNVFRFYEPDGTLRNYYCNVAMPATFENGVLDFVDLDIDVAVWPDFRHEILDLVDFEQNALKYDYPEVIKRKATESLEELIQMIIGREFPFSECK
ncbi:MAG: DUF402 domain-containing protein [Pyrinomonadaceae bacterium]